MARAVSNGVGRGHLLGHGVDGALLRELFAREGCGTQVVTSHGEALRPARADDLGGIIELIRPLEDAGVLVRRSRERLEQELDNFTVMALEGLVIGCAALYPWDGAGELACLAVHPEFRDHALRGSPAGAEQPTLGELLLAEVERQAREQGLSRLFALTTRAEHWFLEHGFRAGNSDDLPQAKPYNLQRNSRVLVKGLGA